MPSFEDLQGPPLEVVAFTTDFLIKPTISTFHLPCLFLSPLRKHRIYGLFSTKSRMEHSPMYLFDEFHTSKFPMCENQLHDMSTIIIANVHDFGCGMPILLIMEVPSNLLVLLISKPTTIVPF